MYTAALDHRALLQELPAAPLAASLAHATLGHVHLQVSDLAAARKFYTAEIGLAVRQDSYPDAVFMAADGYHHHVAINTWGHPGKRGIGPLTGLVGFTAATTRVTSSNELVDPDGIHVKLEPLGSS
jgi:catechol 2,3-dioxygenase